MQGLRKDVSDVEVQQGAALVNIEKEQQWFLDNPNAFKGGQLYKDAEKRLADAQNTYNDVTKRLGILQGKLYTAGADIPTGAVIAPAASETLKLAQVRAQEVAAFKSQRENALGALQTNIGGIKGGDQNVAVSNEHYHGRYEDYHTNFTAATLGSANKGLNISIALPFGKG